MSSEFKKKKYRNIFKDIESEAHTKYADLIKISYGLILF